MHSVKCCRIRSRIFPYTDCILHKNTWDQIRQYFSLWCNLVPRVFCLFLIVGRRLTIKKRQKKPGEEVGYDGFTYYEDSVIYNAHAAKLNINDNTTYDKSDKKYVNTSLVKEFHWFIRAQIWDYFIGWKWLHGQFSCEFASSSRNTYEDLHSHYKNNTFIIVEERLFRVLPASSAENALKSYSSTVMTSHYFKPCSMKIVYGYFLFAWNNMLQNCYWTCVHFVTPCVKGFKNIWINTHSASQYLTPLARRVTE